MRSIRALRACAALTTLLSLTALPAWACTFQATPQGPRIVDCNLRSFSDGAYDVDITTAGPDLRRRLLPNLVPTSLSVDVSGTVVNIDLTVRNTSGIINAPAFEMGTLWWLSNPLDGTITLAKHPAYLSVMANPLPRMSSRSYTVRSLGLPNRTQDWDVCVSAVVDPVPSGGPAQGRVTESNEDDNLLQQCCRVYGPNPNLSGPPACG